MDRLLSVREQLGSLEVLNILHSLEQAHSTYSQAFIHVHRDISKVRRRKKKRHGVFMKLGRS